MAMRERCTRSLCLWLVLVALVHAAASAPPSTICTASISLVFDFSSPLGSFSVFVCLSLARSARLSIALRLSSYLPSVRLSLSFYSPALSVCLIPSLFLCRCLFLSCCLASTGSLSFSWFFSRCFSLPLCLCPCLSRFPRLVFFISSYFPALSIFLSV